MIFENSGLALSLVAAFASFLGVLAAMFGYLSARRQSIYSEKLHRAVLSEIRESYESQISRLTMQLTATEDRWREVNHLIISGQVAQTKLNPAGGKPEFVSFLNRFGIDRREIDVDPRLIFVLTPFTKEETDTFDMIRKSLSDLGFKVVRGDEESATGDVLGHIIRTMVRARIVVVNITSRNPNVFYELGIAHAISKPTLLIAEAGSSHPFDIQSVRIIMYHGHDELGVRIRDAVARILVADEEDARRRPKDDDFTWSAP